MRVLIVDTALGACTACVVEDGRLLGVRSELMTKGHQERLAGMVRDAVADAEKEAGGGFEALDRIGVTVGPGSFTGLRVGLAFAQGLGAALDRPVIGLSTLDGLAVSIKPAGLVAAVIDARRGQVYARLFRDGRPLGPAEALSLDAAADRIFHAAAGAPPILAGSGAGLLVETFPERLGAAVTARLPAPSPEALAYMTAVVDPAAAPPRPLYLRAPDAVPPSRLPGQPRPSATT
ncbi:MULTISPECIES: tRNA (adenosine(37)-N6)-threonylcarbamoyltransferase complex dimerization subunit type 1 TsaB [unclassified Brevundimonas]|uniref:tRNA (adenosine(37)-N6)-threonylcarbamoyltransferase complex dimerization subunit type 1 TsaB n=1 Tax=unclassified Brevundimonas TaxID=2622653 RepID=UPI0025BF4C8B|nr:MULTISPECIES: tRNA (adenosine(37)-N6)-threonylcarbamoyltransferase complex dimerization subunit type 1 TsaB [unclassified Brevundimonas]